MAGRAAVVSAGLLLYRRGPDGGLTGLTVLICHMGGPFWAKKDDRAWSIPKGEHGPEESPRAAAAREFEEELGSPPPDGEWRELGTVRQGGGKLVTAFALAADFDAAHITPGTFEMEWPPRSGRTRTFPEIDRAEWCDVKTARRRLVAGQVPLLDRLTELEP